MDTYKRISIPKIGDIAPEFESYSTTGAISLALFSGQNIVLYFYPQDMTPGCTIQAREFTELYSRFKELDTIIMGVSTDNLASHIRFCEQEHIPYPLLSDTYKEVCNKYGVIKNRLTFNMAFTKVNRTTFLIGKSRKIFKVWYDVRPLGHAGKVLDAIEIMSMMPDNA